MGDPEPRRTPPAAQASPPRAAEPGPSLGAIREQFRASGRSDAEWAGFLSAHGIKPKQTVTQEKVKALAAAWLQMVMDRKPSLTEQADQAGLELE